MKKDQYKPAGKRATILLFKKILEATPELLQQIAPHGFENSVYHRILHGDLEADYNKYRTLRITRYKWNLFWFKKPVYTPKISLEEFKKTYQPCKVNIPAEILSLMAIAMTPVFSKYHVVYDRKGLDHGLIFQNFFADYFLTAANRLSLYNGQQFSMKDLFDRYIYDNNIDLAPFYDFLFYKFKELKIGFYYEKAWPEFDGFMDCLEESIMEQRAKDFMETYNPEEAVLKEIHAEKEIQDLNHERDLQAAAGCMVPCEIVRAYVNVHGEYPEGYL